VYPNSLNVYAILSYLYKGESFRIRKSEEIIEKAAQQIRGDWRRKIADRHAISYDYSYFIDHVPVYTAKVQQTAQIRLISPVALQLLFRRIEYMPLPIVGRSQRSTPLSPSPSHSLETWSWCIYCYRLGHGV
jgi:hypothetical protein